LFWIEIEVSAAAPTTSAENTSATVLRLVLLRGINIRK
jgi:hypothetical protein